MAAIIGTKVGMTSVFDENGRNIPCTVIEAKDCIVSQIKTHERDGYSAVQLSAITAKDKRTSAAVKGHLAKVKASSRRIAAEFPLFEVENQTLSAGQDVLVSIFKEGEFVDVTGTSKGKGFQGVVKRHHFAGVGQATLGQHNRLRAPGSIGACSTPARVFKGLKMAGKMGNRRVTVQNLRVVKVLAEQGLLLLRGAVPGHKGAHLRIQGS